MSKLPINDFVEKLLSDKIFSEQLANAIGKKHASHACDAAVDFGNKNGFTFNASDVTAAQKQVEKSLQSIKTDRNDSNDINMIKVTETQAIAKAPAMAMGSLYQTIGNSVAMAAANAVYAQQQANVTYQAASTLGITKLFAQNG